MNAEKRTKFDESSSLDTSLGYTGLCKPLEASKVERGQVFVQDLLETSKVKVSLLAVSPGGQIKKHIHKEDSEIYIFPVAQKIETCNKGESHSLTNYSKTESLFVISLKYEFDSTDSEDKLYCEERVISTINGGEAKQMSIYEDDKIKVYMFVLYPRASLKKPELNEDGWIFLLEDRLRTEHWGKIYEINPSNKPLYVLGLKYK